MNCVTEEKDRGSNYRQRSEEKQTMQRGNLFGMTKSTFQTDHKK